MNSLARTRTRITRKYVFELYEKVRKNDLPARGRLIDLHALSFPNKTHMRVDQHANSLHAMYLDLERKYRDII